MTTSMPTQDQQQNDNYYNGLLEEYKALRAEIIAQFQNRNNVLTIGSATLGVLFNVAASVGKDETKIEELTLLRIEASVIVLAITVPLVCSLIIFLWGAYSSRVATLGSYLHEKERDMNKMLAGKIAFNWEHRLRDSRDKVN